jgi:dipeptidyl aminopeptidase/acylaminoacyl peptidase
LIATCVLVALVAAPAARAAFPGENGRIAFSGGIRFNQHIATANPDGSDARSLTGIALPSGEREPSWSPDGKRLVFARHNDQSSMYEIWVMNADGGNLRRVTSGFPDDSPQFTPDGSRIVFTRTRAHGQDLMLVNVDGSGLVPLTDTFLPQEQNPTVSPDGRLVAFDTTEGTGSVETISIMPTAGGAPVALATGELVSNPDFSPDGSKIAFDSCLFAVSCSLQTVPVTGGPPTPVPVLTAGNPVHPAFSPDGTKLAVTIFGGGDALVTLPADGGPIQSQLEPYDRYPSWQPAPDPEPEDELKPRLEATSAACLQRSVSIRGTPGADAIKGTQGDDVISGLGGRDVITGKGGDDVICGSNGRDKLLGQGGTDVLVGGAGSDLLKGGGGDRNRLIGGTPGAAGAGRARDVCVVGEKDSHHGCRVIR